MTVDPSPSIREIWKELVVAGIRSRLGLVSFALMVVATVWEFARGNIALGCAFIAIIAFVFLRVPWAVALAVQARRGEGH